MLMITPTRRLAAASLAVALTLTAAACGDDDESATPRTTTAGDDASLVDYCEAEVEVDGLFQNLDPSDADAFAAGLDEAAPAIDKLRDLVPDQIAEPMGILLAGVDGARSSGDPSALFDRAFGEADRVVHTYDLGHCGWTVTEITAADFHFTGALPDSPGTYSVELRNNGAEPHLLILARKKDDVGGTALDTFNGLEGEHDFPTKFDQIASVYADPGDSEYGLADLPAGDYVAFCPIPIGSTPENEGSGDPHFTEGMVEAFTIS